MVPKYVLINLKCNIVRPLVCSRAMSATVPRGAALTLTFMVMVGCLTVLLSPFVASFFRALFRAGSGRFPFVFGLYVALLTV